MADDLHCKLCKLLILKRGSQHRRLVNSILPMTDAFIYDVLQTVYDYKEDDSGYVCIACVALLRRAYRQNTQHATLPPTSREKKNTIKLSTLERKPNITMKPIPKKEPNTTKQSSSTVKRDTTMHSTPIKKPNTTMQSAPTEELDTSMESSAVEMNTTMQSASSDEIDSTMQTMPREEPDTLLQSTPESTNEITGETINVPRSPQRTSPIGPQKKGTKVSFLYLTDLAKAAPVIKKPAKVRPSQCFIKRHLSRGRYGAGIKGILKKGEPAKVAFREVLKNIVKTEIRTYMSIASFPELNDSSSLEDVGWSEIIKDMTATMPTIMDVMEAIMPQRTAPNKKRQTLARIGCILSIVLYSSKPTIFKYIQSLISNEMWRSKSSEKLFRYLNIMGICQPRPTTLQRHAKEPQTSKQTSNEQVADLLTGNDEEAPVSITIATEGAGVVESAPDAGLCYSIDIDQEVADAIGAITEVNDGEEIQIADWTFQEAVVSKSPKKSSQKSLFNCPDCDKVFVKKTDWKQHRFQWHDYRPFECSECGKKFKRTAHLRVHSYIHSGLRPFPCNLCSRTFSDPSTLEKHRRICLSRGRKGELGT